MPSSTLGTKEEIYQLCKEHYLSGVSSIQTTDFLARDYDFLCGLEERREFGNVSPNEPDKAIAGKSTYLLQGSRYAHNAASMTLCGNFAEVWIPRIESETTIGAQEVNNAEGAGKTHESAESIAARTNARARKAIRQLVNANNLNVLLTLTFAPDSPKNKGKYATLSKEEQSDYDTVRYVLSKFRKRLARRFPGLKWLIVLELHNSEQTSAEKLLTWHVHIATDETILQGAQANSKKGREAKVAKLLTSIWRHGICHAVKFEGRKARKNKELMRVSNPGLYLSAYIGKDGNQFTGKDLVNKKRYVCSQSLERPKKEVYKKTTLVAQGFKKVGDSDVIVNGFYLGTSEFWRKVA